MSFHPLLRKTLPWHHARRFLDPSRSLPAIPTVLQRFSRPYADYLVVKVPHMADSISEGTLKEWHKQPGEFVKADEEVTRIETDKIDVAVNTPKSGVLVELYSKPDDTVTVGADLFKLELKEAPPEASTPPKEPPSKPSSSNASETSASTTPQTSSGVQKASPPSMPPTPGTASSPAPSTPSKPPAPSFVAQGGPGTASRGEEKVKMTRMRLRIAERLKAAQNTAAALTTFNEVDLSTLVGMRARFQATWAERHGVKLGFMSLFMKAAAQYAIPHVPVINARLEDNAWIVYPGYVDLSVAVATPKGLVTPVLRDCHQKSLVDLEKELASLSKRARDNQLTVEDMAGGTFTISNGGVFGSLFGTPILNPPQSAILGMHAIKERPVVVNGKIEIRPMMYICLTYDHRLIDGREAVTFLVKLKEVLEDPINFLFQ